MTQQEQAPPAIVVTIVQEPVRQQTVGDLIIGALGVAGVLVILALLLGAVVGIVLVGWNRLFPPHNDHLPPVIPQAPNAALPPSSQSR